MNPTNEFNVFLFFQKLHGKNVAISKYNNIYLRVVQSTTFNVTPLIQFNAKFKIVGILIIAKKIPINSCKSYVWASWNKYKLFVAATAIMFSCGCQAV